MGINKVNLQVVVILKEGVNNMKANCNCKHVQQDTLHGKGIRVFNPTTEKAADNRIKGRCTVCLSTKEMKKQ